MPAIDHASRGLDRPPLHVVRASVTTGYSAEHQRPIHTELTEGGALAVKGAALSASIRIFFDRFLLPHKVIRQSLCVHPSTREVNELADCEAPAQPFTEVEYNPVLRMVTYRLNSSVRLQPNTRYRVSIFAPSDIEQYGFFAFDGAPLAQKYVFDFVTQPSGGADVQELLPGPDAYCGAVKCFADCPVNDVSCQAACRSLCVDQELALVADGEQLVCLQEGNLIRGTPPKLFESCTEGGCHRAEEPWSEAPDPSTIAMGLDLFSHEGIRLTAIGRTAHQTQYGQQSSVPDESPQRFGRAMAIIDPGKPGASYMMYKILANVLNHHRPAGSVGALAGELEQIRDSVVVGLPMPAQAASEPHRGLLAEELDPDGRKSFAMALLINTWIANGAVLSCE